MTEVRIEICNACKGEGLKYHEQVIDYHKRDYVYESYPCTTCDGSGRLRVTIIKEPYVPPPTDRPQE